MSAIIGVDPDLHSCGVAMGTSDGVLLGSWCVSIDWASKDKSAVVEMIHEMHCSSGYLLSRLAFGDAELIVVEGQQLYANKTQVKQDLLNLALVSGGMTAALMGRYPKAGVIIPLPSQWKGQTPKDICQTRAYEFFGHRKVQKVRDYVIPSDPYWDHNVRAKGHWKHVGDAVALVAWAAKKNRT